MTAFHCLLPEIKDIVIAFGVDNIEYSWFRKAHNSSWDTIFPDYQMRKGGFPFMKSTTSNFRFYALVSYPTDYVYVRNSKIPKITWGEDVSFYDDIAMIKMRVPIEFTNTVRPICLPSPGENFKVNLISSSDCLNIS